MHNKVASALATVLLGVPPAALPGLAWRGGAVAVREIEYGSGQTIATKRGGGTLREAYALGRSSLSWDLMTISKLRSETVLGVGKSEPGMPQEQ